MARAFLCLLGFVITVQLTSHKRLVGFRLAVLEDNGVGVGGHDRVDVQKLADERGADGRILDPGHVRERQDLRVLDRAILLRLLVVVQRPLVNGYAQTVRGFLHHDRTAFGQLVDANLIVAVEIAIEDLHSISHFLPV